MPAIPDDLVQRFLDEDDRQNASLWHQGDMLVDFIAEVFPDGRRSAGRSQFYQEFAQAVNRTHHVIRLRYRTSKAFPETERAADRTWYYHAVCAKTESDDCPGRAVEWLKLALEHDLTQTELENLTAATKGEIDMARSLSDEQLDEAILLGSKYGKSGKVKLYEGPAQIVQIDPVTGCITLSIAESLRVMQVNDVIDVIFSKEVSE